MGARPRLGRRLLLKTSFLSKSQKREGLNVGASPAGDVDVSVRLLLFFFIHLKRIIVFPQPLTPRHTKPRIQSRFLEVYILVFSGLAPFDDVGPSIRTIIFGFISFEIAFLPALGTAGRGAASEWGGAREPRRLPREGRLPGAQRPRGTGPVTDDDGVTPRLCLQEISVKVGVPRPSPAHASQLLCSRDAVNGLFLLVAVAGSPRGVRGPEQPASFLTHTHVCERVPEHVCTRMYTRMNVSAHTHPAGEIQGKSKAESSPSPERPSGVRARCPAGGDVPDRARQGRGSAASRGLLAPLRPHPVPPCSVAPSMCPH